MCDMINHLSKSLILCLYVFRTIVLDVHGKWVWHNAGVDLEHGEILIEYPGTKWCGHENTARNHDDLGEERDTDICCRDHDGCPDYILGRSSDSKYGGLTNKALFARLSCACDLKLHQCLKDNVVKNNSTSSHQVGYIFFDLLHAQCFAFDHPIIGCEEFYDDSSRCRHYKLNETEAPIWQWFDDPLFVED